VPLKRASHSGRGCARIGCGEWWRGLSGAFILKLRMGEDATNVFFSCLGRVVGSACMDRFGWTSVFHFHHQDPNRRCHHLKTLL
jgi:hypothetical protein